MAAPFVSVPDTAFAASVHRLFRACARSCPTMADISMNFVRAERLHLQLFFSEAQRLLRIHERWLCPDGAATELGLAKTPAMDDLVYHTVKRLFAEALEQFPSQVFLDGKDNTRTAEWRRKQDATEAEQRVLEYQRMGDFTVHRHSGTAPELVLRRSHSARDDEAMEIEVQCHRASCQHARDPLIAADGTYSKSSENLTEFRLYSCFQLRSVQPLHSISMRLIGSP